MFAIRPGNPVHVAVRDVLDSSLSDAVQTVFPREELVFLEWNGLAFPLSYKYDVGMMVDDIVEMILAVRKAGAGLFQVDWPSSGFPYHWVVRWDMSGVEVHAHPRDEPGAVSLAGRESIRVDREAFLRAWQVLLKNVLAGLEEAGYDSIQISGLSRLRAAASHR